MYDMTCADSLSQSLFSWMVLAACRGRKCLSAKLIYDDKSMRPALNDMGIHEGAWSLE